MMDILTTMSVFDHQGAKTFTFAGFFLEWSLVVADRYRHPHTHTHTHTVKSSMST